MKNENTKEISEIFNGFGGIDLTSPIGSGRLSRLKNFRLLSDGSIIKRSGFGPIAFVESGVRGAAAYIDGGDEVILAVSSSCLYRITLDGDVSFSSVLDSEEGDVGFFELRGDLYLLDGKRIYRYTGGTGIAPCEAYAPLYGKDWTANMLSTYAQNEPLNLLSPRVRVQYKSISDQVNVLSVGLPIESIDAVFVGGLLQNKSLFSIHRDGDKVACNGFYPGNGAQVILYVTLADGVNEDPDFNGYSRAAVFDSFAESRVFLYDSEGESFYVSPTVDERVLNEERSVYDRVDPIYLPKGGAVHFGGMNGINGMCRVSDRMLIFSSFRTWMTSSLLTDEGKSRLGVALEVVSETVGCSSRGAVRVVGGAKPVTVSRGGIFKWSFDSEFEEEAVVTRVSDRVAPHMTEGFLKNAAVCYSGEGGELWFGNRSSEDGEVLVYDLERGVWWSYDGVFADRFIETGRGVAFVSGNGIYLFDKDAAVDITEDGERCIDALVESAGFDFSARTRKKQICGVSVLGELDGGSVRVELDDGRLLSAIEFDGSSASPIHAGAELVDLRANTNRTERVRFRLGASGKSRQRIYGVEFRATV